MAPQAELERLLSGQAPVNSAAPASPEPSEPVAKCAGEAEPFCGVLTAEEARRLAKTCGGTLRLGPGAILTPLARDVLREKRVALVYEEERLC